MQIGNTEQRIQIGMGVDCTCIPQGRTFETKGVLPVARNHLISSWLSNVLPPVIRNRSSCRPLLFHRSHIVANRQEPFQPLELFLGHRPYPLPLLQLPRSRVGLADEEVGLGGPAVPAVLGERVLRVHDSWRGPQWGGAEGVELSEALENRLEGGGVLVRCSGFDRGRSATRLPFLLRL